jgi:predicted metal-dependent peptidase
MTNASTATEEVKNKNVFEKASADTTTAAEREQCLATTLYALHKSHTFYAGLFQCMNITYSHQLPTAGVSFSIDMKRYELWLNPMFFCKALNQDQRQAVMLHEVGHLINQHLTRVPFMKMSNHNRKLMNIAGDLSLNCYIQHLPRGCPQCPPKEDMLQGAKCENELCCGFCMDVADFYTEAEDGTKTPWPTGETMEQYFLRLKDKYKEQDEGEEGEGDSDGEGDYGGDSGKPGTPRQFDSHDWEANGDEKEMLEAMEDLVKRAQIKTSTSFDNLPSHVQKLLEEIKSRKAELNYKALILAAIKKSASGQDRKSTWTRKSRRFGNLAPGNREGPLPSISIVMDTSGSISISTLNDFLSVCDEFLRVGTRKCSLHLFSDKEYHSQNYKMGDRVAQDMLRQNVKMGGTCLEDTLQKVLKRNSDLTLIFTDGYYSKVEVDKWLKPNQRFPQVLFVIEKEGRAPEANPFFGETWANTVKIPK